MAGKNGLLEILNDAGRIFSRFSCDKSKGMFVHTNDPDTLSIRFQRYDQKNETHVGRGRCVAELAGTCASLPINLHDKRWRISRRGGRAKHLMDKLKRLAA